MKYSAIILAAGILLASVGLSGCKNAETDGSSVDQKRIESVTPDNALETADEILKEINEI